MTGSGGADVSGQADNPPGGHLQPSARPPDPTGTANDSPSRRGSTPPTGSRGSAPGQPAGSSGPDRTGPRRSPDGGESRYRRAPIIAEDIGAGQRPAGAVRLTLTEPATAPMTAQEYDQAVTALASMIATWLRRHQPTDTDGA